MDFVEPKIGLIFVKIVERLRGGQRGWGKWKGEFLRKRTSDVPPNSLTDSIANPKVKTIEGERVGVCFLTCNTSKIERCARVSRWGLG